MTKRHIKTLAVLAVTMAAAFAIRVIPAWSAVFDNDVVSFQEGDAWFHVRTVHNLLAHFPWRSGFDPYMLYPGGRNIPTGPMWDYVLATPAWLLGLGRPSDELIDTVCAWMPALLGALFPIPAFFLARRLFGELAAALAALWCSVAGGLFLWMTHLGLADHHAAESLFSFSALFLLCESIESARPGLSWAAGIATGLFLATRPVGFFVPALFAAVVVIAPLAAPYVLRAVIAASVVFLCASGSLWSGFSWSALGLTAAFCAFVMALEFLGHSRAWPTLLRRGLPYLFIALGVLAVAIIRPPQALHLAEQVQRLAGQTSDSRAISTVGEMQPLWRAGTKPGWPSVFGALGLVWIPAIAGLFLLLRRWPLSAGRWLFLLWTVTMAAASLAQLRMAIYLTPVAAVLAGAACARLAELFPSRRLIVAAVIGLIVLPIEVLPGISQTSQNHGPSPDLIAALAWLSEHTPEPLESVVWTAYYPHREPEVSATPGWGVAVWWDFGYEVEQMARRMPMSNGTQGGAEEMARFYLETVPEAAVARLRRDGARYAIVDERAPFFVNQNESYFPAMTQILGRNFQEFVAILAERGEGTAAAAVPVYLENYYQTMAARLYLHDGEAAKGDGPWAFEVEPNRTLDGKEVNVIIDRRQCSSEKKLREYTASRKHVVVGCLDPGRSCFDLPAVKGMKLVFTSDILPISHDRSVRAVKVFQVTPE